MLLASCSLRAANDTQKTELVLRNHLQRAANLTTFHRLKPNNKRGIWSKLQMTGFYNETTKEKELGQVFGTQGRNYVIIGTGAQVTAGTADVDGFLIDHHQIESDADRDPLQGKVHFNPKRTSYGTCLEGVMKLDKIMKGLYLKKSMTLMNVKHRLDVKYTDLVARNTNNKTTHSIEDLLSGKRVLKTFHPTASNAANVTAGVQEPLNYAKITNNSYSRTGLSNLETVLGWKFLRRKKFYMGISTALTAPSGDRPTGEYLWEERLGSKHWGLGFGLKAGFKPFKKLKFMMDLNFKHEFSATEKRTLGIKDDFTSTGNKNHVFSPYYLLGESGQRHLTPAANILTKDVSVKPGYSFDGIFMMSYKFNCFSIDLGYDLYCKEKEDVSLKSSDWTKDKYGIAKFSFPTFTAATPFTVATTANTKFLAYENIDTSVAETPSILSHSIFGSIGYISKADDNPVMFNLGGAYEFGTSRPSIDGFMLWAKLGFAF